MLRESFVVPQVIVLFKKCFFVFLINLGRRDKKRTVNYLSCDTTAIIYRCCLGKIENFFLYSVFLWRKQIDLLIYLPKSNATCKPVENMNIHTMEVVLVSAFEYDLFLQEPLKLWYRGHNKKCASQLSCKR